MFQWHDVQGRYPPFEIPINNYFNYYKKNQIKLIKINKPFQNQLDQIKTQNLEFRKHRADAKFHHIHFLNFYLYRAIQRRDTFLQNFIIN